MRKEQDHTL